ncbi:MAG TPA: isoaspartyl peptidase/L-asparaginase [Myxococcales bacterium]|nr:isoaspartyl peptidase/L-asparaginase [Myxococcales bacterium]
MSAPFAIAVHGGAGPVAPDDQAEAARLGCLRAAREGHAVLRAGGSALDAVVEAVAALEDDPLFNAGTGACLNEDGEVELDASVMEGERLGAGAVALVRTVKNPVRLARAVMERTPHVFLAGEGARALALEVGMEEVDPGSLVVPRMVARWERDRAKRAQPPAPGTVGAVAVDARGRVAAATSTGGTGFKRRGRIGDTPLIGCGTYADGASGAASATGHGEAIIKVVLAKAACDALARGLPAPRAAEEAVALLGRVGGAGGLILVSRAGEVGLHFNTERMARAWIDAAGAERSAFTRGEV